MSRARGEGDRHVAGDGSRSSYFATAAVILFFAGSCYWYYAPTTPMTPEEVEESISILDQSTRKYEFPDGHGLDPEEIEALVSQLREFAANDDGRPFYMANIMKLRDDGEPLYPAAFPNPTGSAEEADEAYGLAILPLLLKMGAHPVYLSTAGSNALRFGATEEHDGWGQVALLRYRSRRDFFRMLTAPAYEDAVIHQFASMKTILVTPTTPSDCPSTRCPTCRCFSSSSLSRHMQLGSGGERGNARTLAHPQPRAKCSAPVLRQAEAD